MRTFYLLASIIILAAFIAPLVTVQAARPSFVFPAGCCYYNGEVVRTVVPPSAFPNEGRDNFYMITNGVSGQKPVVAVAPGDIGYHGGSWAVYLVTFKEDETPFLLTSATAVLAAQSGGDVTITRARTMDFLCPIQL
jgi:hypothetical protein